MKNPENKLQKGETPLQGVGNIHGGGEDRSLIHDRAPSALEFPFSFF
jgi:hypothetical protein